MTEPDAITQAEEELYIAYDQWGWLAVKDAARKLALAVHVRACGTCSVVGGETYCPEYSRLEALMGQAEAAGDRRERLDG